MIFKNIAVIPNEKKDPFFEHTKNLINYLSDKNINIFLNEIYKQKINNCVLKYTNEENLYQSCDLLIALGGDGTILRTASHAFGLDKPVIGVNLGTIGFMSEIEAHEIELFDKLFSGNFTIESRMMLDVEIIKKDAGVIFTDSALNDAVVSHGSVARLIEIDLFCDGVKITHYRADGVIIATPTGSTAYSMSAGGPIIDPNIACLCVTPICSHSLINRPVIFSHDSVLEIKNRNVEPDAYLSIDGRVNLQLDKSDIVRIRKSQHTTKLISVKNHGFFEVIREKISEH
jgi:NAD+ kinase